MTTATDLINQLVELRAERAELDAREEFLKDQLQGAITLGELDGYQTDAGVYEFDNAKYIRSERNTYKLSKEAEKAIRTIKEQDIDAGLAKRNVTVFYQLRIAS